MNKTVHQSDLITIIKERGFHAWALVGLSLSLIAGCGQQQSSLNPAGEGARQIAELFWYMTLGGFVIWLVVVSLFVYAMFFSPLPHNDRRSRLTVIGGGVVVPTVVLTGLLSYGLAMLPDLQSPARAGSLVIEVTGLQYWWRVQYPRSAKNEDATASVVETANEIVLPVGQEVEFKLHSDDVIHSFWIPSIGGKVDMMPGRINRLKLAPTRTGHFRGVCAEYCGEAHALMAFDVRVVELTEFNQWFAHQAAAADTPLSPDAVRGAEVFLSLGCGACHAVRGTNADGRYGPDLTHFGSRPTFAAGSFKNDASLLEKWILQTHQMKQGVLMPSFEDVSDDDRTALVAYLKELR